MGEQVRVPNAPPPTTTVSIPPPPPSDEPDNILGALGTRRGLALALAVLHYGFSCLAENSVPANPSTVMRTAELFEGHLLSTHTE